MNKNFTGYAAWACVFAAILCITNCGFRKPEARDARPESANHEWKVIGPGAGGGVFIPTVSPFDTSLVFAKGDMTGAFVTDDGGKNWNLFNLMTVVQDFEFDPVDSNHVYAACRGYLYDEDRGSGLTMLYRSDNKGKTWKVIYPDIAKIRPLEKLQSQSYLPSQLVPGMPDGSIDLIRVDPSDHNRIYLGLSPLRPYIGELPASTPRMIFLVGTEDMGKNWKLIAKVPGTSVIGLFPHVIAAEKNEMTVITDETCMKVNLTTGEASPLPHPAGRITGSAYGFDSGSTSIYLLTDAYRDRTNILKGGIFRSDDGGLSWSDINKDLVKNIPGNKTPIYRAMAVCQEHPAVAYLSLTTPATGPGANKNVRYEIYRTDNSGSTWEKVYSANSDQVLTHNFDDSWLNWSYGPGWGGDALTLGVAPSDPDICYATDYGQAYKTSNGGKTWHQVCSRNYPDSSVSSTGLDLTCCYGVSFDPFDPDHLVVSYIDIGLFHSFDGGKTWKQQVKGIPTNWVNTCYHITFDPAVKGRVWSTWADQHSLPRRSQFGDGQFKGHHGGIAYSDNSGRTWTISNSGMPDNSITTDLLLDSLSVLNSRTLYASTFNQGVYKSTDGGKTWINKSKGLKGNHYAWEIRRAGNRVYLLCVRGWKEETSIDGKLYYSDDGAENWYEAKLPEGVTAPTDLLVDPQNPAHMYLSCWPKHSNGADVCGGVYETTNGGNNWKQCFDERIRVFAAAFDPRDTRKIFINTFQNAAYRSDNGGITWNRIPGYRFKWGHCPVPDLHHPGMLYLTTYGVSIYYGPSTGTQEEFGRIENLPDKWW